MGLVRVVCGGVVFWSAFLLFAVEPMAAKRLLPMLGGSSAVWVTCLVFFQGMLLVGYLYAWWMGRRNAIRVHCAMLLAAAAVLAMPLVLVTALGMDMHLGAVWAADHPVRTIFLALGATIGLPFLVLAATSPLVQVWVASGNDGRVPYGLFALSNAGSLLGLVAYPALLEPRFTLAQQSIGWAAGFGLFAAASGWLAWRIARDRGGRPVEVRETPGAPPPSLPEEAADDRPPGPRRWIWFLLPMVASMQLCAVTSHLSQDVAAIPMLWVLPLGAYLLSFIVAFEMPKLYRRWLVGRMLAVMLASLGYALSKVDTTLPVGMAILFYLVELGLACWFCHAEVYRLRPLGPRSAAESSGFYLCLAAGGVVGTFLVAIASPLLFRANYDLAIAFLATAAVAICVTWRDGWGQRLVWVTGTALLLALTILLRVEFGRHALMQARNFYGSLRVVEAGIDTGGAVGNAGDSAASAEDYSPGTGPVRVLMNGRIRHGTQMLSAEGRLIPTTYYALDSGVGVALTQCCTGRPKTVGVVGLGAGTLSAYGAAGDRMRFYEINPLVEGIARNLFTYMQDSAATIVVVGGDGRASLEREVPQHLDVLVVDAFSGDAIPLHLLTREAMQVYRRQLVPGGIVAFHVSNSYLDLAPEIALLAKDAGMQAARVQSGAVPARGEYRATWVLVSANTAFFALPGVRARTTEIGVPDGMRVWTDDYSSLLGVMRWTR